MTDPQTDPVATSKRPSNDPVATSKRPQRKNDKNVRSKEGKNVVVSESCKKVFELFNQTCVSLEPIKEPTELNIRRVSGLLQQHSGFDFYNYFLRVEKSDFLTRRNRRWNIGGTKATFDWILKPENILKINSGQYDNTEENNTDGRNSSISDEDLELVQGIGTWY